MKMKITVRRGTETLYSLECDVSAKGDLEKAVAEAMEKARIAAGFGPAWDFDLSVEKM